MSCPDENDLARYIAAQATEAERTAIEAHLDTCAGCRAVVGGVLHAEEEGTTTATSLPRSTSASKPWARGALVAERYVLESEVGRGATGAVWAARDSSLGVRVALKVLRLADDRSRKRFLREARIGSFVIHEAVVRTHAVLEEGTSLVLVMDLLEGTTFGEHLQRRGKLPYAEAHLVFSWILRGLAAAHAMGIIHRDMKPSNVFILPGAEGCPVRILDFGLAKLTADDGVAAETSILTKQRTAMGTPGYMAPEQLYADPLIDEGADIWAVGVMLYEALTGRRPFAARTMGRYMRELTMETLRPLAELVTGLPPPVYDLVGRMLAVERAARPRSADEVLQVWAACPPS